MIRERLRSERQRLGLSQAAAASRIGVSRSMLLRWEKGDATPDGDSLLRWAYEVAPWAGVVYEARQPVALIRTEKDT